VGGLVVVGVTQFEGTSLVIVEPLGTQVLIFSILLTSKSALQVAELALPSLQVTAFGSSHFKHYEESPGLVPKPSIHGVEQTPPSIL
jgi:hypothetical protein